MNHAISIVGYWICDSNYEQELFLTRKSLDLIWSPPIDEEKVVKFEKVFFLLDTCGSQVILKSYKYEDIGNMTIQKNKIWQERITKLNLHIDIW